VFRQRVADVLEVVFVQNDRRQAGRRARQPRLLDPPPAVVRHRDRRDDVVDALHRGTPQADHVLAAVGLGAQQSTLGGLALDRDGVAGAAAQRREGLVGLGDDRQEGQLRQADAVLARALGKGGDVEVIQCKRVEMQEPLVEALAVIFSRSGHPCVQLSFLQRRGKVLLARSVRLHGAPA